MLTILDVNPTGWYSYGMQETVKIDGLGLVFPSGHNHDRAGGSNGAGKSSIPNSIVRILYDRDPLGAKANEAVNNTWGKGAWGKVSFINSRGEKWRVIYCRGWKTSQKCPAAEVESEPSAHLRHGHKYTGTEVYLESWDGTCWVDARPAPPTGARADPKYTRQKIVEVLGETYDRFMSMSYLAQEQALRFVQALPSERVAIFEEMTDLTIWGKAAALANINKKAKLASLVVPQHELAVSTSLMSTMRIVPPSECEKIDSLIAQSEARKAAANLKIQELRVLGVKNAESAKAIQSEISAIQNEVRFLTMAHAEQQTALSVSAATVESKVQSVRATSCADIRAEIQRYTDARQDLASKIMLRSDDLASMMSSGGKCQRCHSNVTEQQIQIERAALMKSIENLRTEVDGTNKLLANVTGRLTQAVDIEVSKIYDNFRIEQDTIKGKQSAILSQIADLNKELMQKNASINAMQALDLHNQIRRLEMQVLSDDAGLAEYDRMISSIIEQQDRHDELAAKIVILSAKVRDTEVDIKHLQLVEKLLGKDMKSHKLGASIDVFNYTLKSYMDILAAGQVSVWIEPFRINTSDELVPEIQILVREGLKQKVDLRLYSGGEKQQIVLAIIASMAKYAIGQGHGTNVMFIDEAFNMMEDSLEEPAMRLISDLRTKDHSTIVINTHSQNIMNTIKFQHIWHIDKRNHQSHLVLEVV